LVLSQILISRIFKLENFKKQINKKIGTFLEKFRKNKIKLIDTSNQGNTANTFFFQKGIVKNLNVSRLGEY
jgi:hypothetical protein